jgi:hypothetical protein
VGHRTSGHVIALCALAGCGRLGFDVGAAAPGSDGGTNDGAPDPLGAFAPPIVIAELSSGSNEYGPTLSPDGGSLVLTSNRDGAYALYGAIRQGNGTFTTPTMLTTLDASGIEFDGDLSEDGLELYFVSGGSPQGLRRSTRATTADPWAAPTVIAFGANHEGPSLMLGDVRMLIATSTGIDEWERPSVGSTAWQRVRSHPSLDGMTWPGARSDGLEVFAIRAGMYRLYRATRASIDDPFGPAQRYLFNSVHDTRNAWDPELSPDGRTMHISIDSGGDHDIFVATR